MKVVYILLLALNTSLFANSGDVRVEEILDPIVPDVT